MGAFLFEKRENTEGVLQAIFTHFQKKQAQHNAVLAKGVTFTLSLVLGVN